MAIAGSVLIIYILLHSMKEMGCNREKSKWTEYGVLTLYTLMAIIISGLGIPFLNVAVVIVAIPIIGYLLYNSEKSYVIQYCILCIGVFIADFLAFVIFQFLVSMEYLEFNDIFYYQIFNSLFVRFIECIVVRSLAAVMKRKQQGQLTMGQFISSFILPVFSIVSLYSMLYLLQVYAGPVQMSLFAFNAILILGLNIYFTYLFEAIAKKNTLENELMLFKQQAEYQLGYYERLERQYQDSKKIIHDIRNHILTIERLSELNEKKKLSQYTKDIHEMLNSLGLKYYTDNKVLNIILNEKIQEMNEWGIKTEIKIHELSINFIKDIDITTIFSNLLDNAIEAAAKAEDKFVEFRGEKKREFISITIRNSYLLEPVKTQNGFLSHKNKHKALGIKNVLKALHKYDGDIQFETLGGNKKIFAVHIMFSIK